jgi:hypothetical protein
VWTIEVGQPGTVQLGIDDVHPGLLLLGWVVSYPVTCTDDGLPPSLAAGMSQETSALSLPGGPIRSWANLAVDPAAQKRGQPKLACLQSRGQRAYKGEARKISTEALSLSLLILYRPDPPYRSTSKIAH